VALHERADALQAVLEAQSLVQLEVARHAAAPATTDHDDGAVRISQHGNLNQPALVRDVELHEAGHVLPRQESTSIAVLCQDLPLRDGSHEVGDQVARRILGKPHER
jgi:hypothetical protein